MTPYVRSLDRWNLLILAVLVATLTACGESAQQGPAPPVPVRVAVARQQAMPVQLEAFGTVETLSSVEVRPQVGGELTRVAFEEGQDVRKGQLLFTIDRRPFQAELAQAEAQLARDKALAVKAEQDVTRYAGLVEKDYVTQEQYDQIKSQAEAQRAAVKADQAAVESARLRVQWSEVRSPIDGRAGAKLVHVGNVVKANPDQPIVVINQLEPIDVRFALPQSYLDEIRTRAQSGALGVEVRSDDDPDLHESGKLTFIDNAVDTATGTIQLKGRFANADHRLWPGQFVRVTLRLTTQENAIVVPSAAIQSGQQGDYLFVVGADQKVESRPVTVDRTLGDQTVIKEGVKAGETVVTDGQLRLVPGAVAKPMPQSTSGSEEDGGSADSPEASTP
jgi:multidrug efflux system membrane fusion protein